MKIRRKLVATVAQAAIVAGGLVAVTSAPAQASWVCDSGISCGKLRHHAPDNGYDRAIIYTADWGNNRPWRARRYLAEGATDNVRDVDGFKLRAGERLTCLRNDSQYGTYWRTEASRVGKSTGKWYQRGDHWDRVTYGGCALTR